VVRVWIMARARCHGALLTGPLGRAELVVKRPGRAGGAGRAELVVKGSEPGPACDCH
jgi:hypothetical protein